MELCTLKIHQSSSLFLWLTFQWNQISTDERYFSKNLQSKIYNHQLLDFNTVALNKQTVHIHNICLHNITAGEKRFEYVTNINCMCLISISDESFVNKLLYLNGSFWWISGTESHRWKRCKFGSLICIVLLLIEHKTTFFCN
jgi:hypothetical protein